MEPLQSGSENHLTRNLSSEGESVPWTPREILEDTHEELPRSSRLGVPFVVQSGSMLLMLEAEDGAWTLAELEFSPRYCFFQEKRRATYTWPREAFGVMLSRLGNSELDQIGATKLAADFGSWLGTRFSRSACSGSIRC